MLREEIVRKIAKIISQFKDDPDAIVAEHIFIEVFEKEIGTLKDNYERLLFTNTDSEN